ncbi:hypothetical protein QLQ15_15950 [Lysobacter sp. LF1]|uniref:DUF3757 domain-containing protein n=1 Tax=Lysobacter stagni TaxID=3045172 RepID=A0ABT6XJP8_9GAMM|nr:hypothetical protein [Lysobacter sp. LF1]MDI9240400.1 hypothetical protein [Lysobacter sp. LF1]
MPRIVAVLVVLCLLIPARADAQRVLGYRCDTAADRLVVYYRNADDIGESAHATEGNIEWDTADLIASMADEDHIGELTTVTGTCALAHATYAIRLGPTPGNFNVQGRCGAVITGWAEVSRGNEAVLAHHEMEGDCHDTTTPITTNIVIAKDRPPVVTAVPADVFFH